MKKKIAMKWIKALRSGRYMQGKGKLRSKSGKLCVLGVLCDLHARVHPETARKQKDPLKYLGQTQVLPIEVLNWSGMDSMRGAFMEYTGQYNSLSRMNDNGEKFSFLAYTLEKIWKDL